MAIRTGRAVKRVAPNGSRSTVFVDYRTVTDGACPFYGAAEAGGGDPHDVVAARRWLRALVRSGQVVPYAGRYASGTVSQPTGDH